MSFCSIENCGKSVASRGWCRMHYVRWQRHGDPLKSLVRHRITGTCEANDCDKPAEIGAGKNVYCVAHGTRWRRYGNIKTLHRASPGDGCIDGWGYKVITVDGKRIREHRHVMQQILGRELTPDEIVHHLDENKANNDPANLKITSRDAHPKEHATFRSETHKECSACHEILPRSEFHRNSLANSSNNRDPHGSQCKHCDLKAQNRRNQLKSTSKHYSDQPRERQSRR